MIIIIMQIHPVNWHYYIFSFSFYFIHFILIFSFSFIHIFISSYLVSFMHYSLSHLDSFYIWHILLVLWRRMNSKYVDSLLKLGFYTMNDIFSTLSLVCIFIFILMIIIVIILMLVMDCLSFSSVIFMFFRSLFIVPILFYNWTYHVDIDNYHQMDNILSHANLYIIQNYNQICMYFLW